MLKSKAISNFLKLAPSPLAKLYDSEMEVQVNVIKGQSLLLRDSNGDAYYTLNDKVWKPFRIPFDGELNFDLSIYAEGIGMTGWNFIQKQSHWVGFDFDSIVNHKAGLSKDDLNSILRKAQSLNYINIYKSTSGKGLHFYIFFNNPVLTETRKEHQALAKAILNYISAEAGFDFTTSVDCLGMILWCWHIKQEGTDGLTLIKEGIKFDTNRIPKNWKDVQKDFSRIKYLEEIEVLIDSSQLKLLSKKQKDFLSWFPKNAKYSWWWEQNISMLVCHTIDIKQAYKDLKLEGIFDTLSTGSSSQNCFLFPYKNNSWICRRYSKNTKEHPIWQTDESGWTRCFINYKVTFKQSCLYRGGQQDSQGFFILTGKIVNKVLSDLIIHYQIPEEYKELLFKIKLKPIGILIQSNNVIQNWISNKAGSEKILQYIEVETDFSDTEVFSLDNVIRDCISEGSHIGWFINIDNEWVNHEKSNVSDLLQSTFVDVNNKTIKTNLGRCIQNPWKIVNKPFREEYPGNREWNKHSAQFAFSAEQGTCDTWFLIFDHLGKELQVDTWCRDNGINNGSDYLFYWVASMFQRPDMALPYLFLWSYPQNTGKSTLHESLKMLFKNNTGYVHANHALTSTSGFNSELDGAVLCIVEELDLSRNRIAYNRIKDWVTSSTLSIRGLYKTPFLTQNTCHWMHCANFPEYCPMFKGDSRILSIQVSEIKKEIPKYQFQRELREQAPAFLHRLLTLNLPVPNSRLGLPCLMTESKKDIIEIQDREDSLDAFVNICLTPSLGNKILWSEFLMKYDEFINLQNGGKGAISRKKIDVFIKRHMPFLKGKLGGYTYLANAKFLKSSQTEKNDFKYILNIDTLEKVPLEETDKEFFEE